ncbi:MAG: FMN-binding protein [Deltaproteobacteria bacterium]|nr:FMN-binding protein [Deltaproteobacteria bacterium]
METNPASSRDCHRTQRHKSRKTDRLLAVLAMGGIFVAFLAGSYLSGTKIEPFLSRTMPESVKFQKLSATLWAAYRSGSSAELVGYVTAAVTNGYGGPMQVAVGVDLQGKVTGLAIVDEKETPTWMQRIVKSNLVASLVGKSYRDRYELGNDVDGVSGATYSSRAITEAVRIANRTISDQQLALPVPPEPEQKIVFGVQECVLIGLFALGFLGYRRGFPYRRQVRWLTMITGLVVLGFIYNSPLTLAFVTKLLMGFWPDWKTHLFMYLLIGGFLFFLVINNRNPYCYWFCPFGAAQECLCAVSGSKGLYRTKRYAGLFKWIQRGLALLAILVGLVFRSPGLSSYEVYGGLFDLTGSPVELILLVLVLGTSFFVLRPWCRYLCPVPPIEGFVRMTRTWIKALRNKTVWDYTKVFADVMTEKKRRETKKSTLAEKLTLALVLVCIFLIVVELTGNIEQRLASRSPVKIERQLNWQSPPEKTEVRTLTAASGIDPGP